MDSNKIKAIIIGALAAFGALYLGIAAATAQLEAVAWIVGGLILTVCLALGRRIWLLLPLMTGIRLVLPLPGSFSTVLLTQLLVIGFLTLLFLTRRLPLEFRVTELELICLLYLCAVIQVYLRNPVGLNIFGGQMVGGKAYFIFGVSFATAAFLSILRIDPNDLKWWVRLSIIGALTNFGLGLIFGVSLTLNFRCPYWSANLRDFWRTWHITLGAWLRDYIYLPLGGRKKGRWILNTLLVFLVSGIWHGAGWGFIIWGLLHGIGVALCASPKAEKKLPWPVRWSATFLYTTAAWLFFMETDPALLREKALGLINPLSYGLAQIKAIPAVFAGPLDAITFALIIGIAFIALLAEGLGIRKNREPYHFGRARIVSALLIFLIVFLAPMEESRFIYFNF